MTENPYIDLIAQGIEERGLVRTAFSGCSMEPTLSDGMLLAIERSEPRNVKVAEIILYRRRDQMVVHRVIKVLCKDGKIVFATKGDNQAYMDCDHVPEENLLGVVRGAFLEKSPQVNVLVDNKLIRLAYVLMGVLAISIIDLRKYVPRKARLVLRYFVGGFFFVLKKFIHTLYLGMRNGQLFFRRHRIKSVGA